MKPHAKSMPYADYAAAPGMRSSHLQNLLVTPAYYRWRLDNPRPQTEAMRWGSLIDLAVTEPDEFTRTVRMIPPDAPRRPTSTQLNAKNPSADTLAAIAWWENWNAETEGLHTLPQDDFARVHLVAERIRAHACMRDILGQETTEFQTCLFWVDEETGIPCKARLDIRHAGGVIVDLKKTQSVETYSFQRSVREYGYDVQAAFYWDGYRAVYGAEPRGFAWMAYEIEPPFPRRFFVAHPDWIAKGREKYRTALRTYCDCVASGQWPDYPETPETLDALPW